MSSSFTLGDGDGPRPTPPPSGDPQLPAPCLLVEQGRAGTRPLLLDLFCGAGGAAVGYWRAGFDIIGVDIAPQPHYPFKFHQADAMTFPLDGYDAIHASPPCKLFTVAGAVHRAAQQRLFEPNLNLLTPTLERLAEHDCGTETPYVVENVPGSPMPDEDVYQLCGSSFGLRVRRHRLFYVSVPIDVPMCDHAAQGQPVGVYGNGGAWTRTAPGGGGVKVAGADAADALGVDWTTYQPALSQMIPPAYTEHIGRQIMQWIGATPPPDRHDRGDTHHNGTPADTSPAHHERQTPDGQPGQPHAPLDPLHELGTPPASRRGSLRAGDGAVGDVGEGAVAGGAGPLDTLAAELANREGGGFVGCGLCHTLTVARNPLLSRGIS